jgi:hypothetical protein
MEKLIKYKYLVLAIIGTGMLIYSDYLIKNKFNISYITIVFGLVPLSVQLYKTIKSNKIS